MDGFELGLQLADLALLVLAGFFALVLAIVIDSRRRRRGPQEPEPERKLDEALAPRTIKRLRRQTKELDDLLTELKRRPSAVSTVPPIGQPTKRADGPAFAEGSGFNGDPVRRIALPLVAPLDGARRMVVERAATPAPVPPAAPSPRYGRTPRTTQRGGMTDRRPPSLPSLRPRRRVRTES